MSIDKIFNNRRENLRLLVKQAGGYARFIRMYPRLDRSADYIAQLCRGYNPKNKSGRNISDETSKEITLALGLDEKYLDKEPYNSDPYIRKNTKGIASWETHAQDNSVFQLANEIHQIRLITMVLLEWCADTNLNARQDILYRLTRLSANRKSNDFLAAAVGFLESADEDVDLPQHRHLRPVKTSRDDQGN